jgi:hypothetical protein
MREEDARVNDAVVHHPERLQIVIERVADEDRARADKRTQGLTSRGEVQHGGCKQLWGNA